MKRHTEHVIIIVAVLAVIAIGLGAFAWSGLYNIGADDPHYKPTLKFLTMARNRSIQVRAESIKVPDLSNRQLILKGAGQYAAMCTSCHLAPGMTDSELRRGLYPQPPNLSRLHFDPRVEFWVIKHGIKMTAMPAWGYTHDDATIWSMVAFLQKLPGMTAAQYKAIVAIAPPDEDMDMGGSHGHSDAPHSHLALPDTNMHGMAMPPASTTKAATASKGSR